MCTFLLYNSLFLKNALVNVASIAKHIMYIRGHVSLSLSPFLIA